VAQGFTGVTATEHVTATGSMNDAREGSQLTLLQNGASFFTRLAGGNSGAALWRLLASGCFPCSTGIIIQLASTHAKGSPD
jgi:hypothetical protein